MSQPRTKTMSGCSDQYEDEDEDELRMSMRTRMTSDVSGHAAPWWALLQPVIKY